MDHILEEMLRKASSMDDSIVLEDTSFPIESDRFRPLPKKHPSSSIAFIDGGSMEIFSSPSLSLYFNRAYAVTYTQNRRVQSHRIGFYVLASAASSTSYRTSYEVVEGSIYLPEMTFDALDPLLKQGCKKAPISVVGNIMRRLAELRLTTQIDADFIVLDGPLDVSYPHEKEFIDALPDNVVGLVKTNDVLTQKGQTATAALIRSTSLPAWTYDIENSLRDICFVKLNAQSDHIFRIEGQITEEMVSLLAENSKDAVFPGYPYGLIEADRFARVSLREKEQMQMKLQMKLQKDFASLRPLLSALNAHSILDTMG